MLHWPCWEYRQKGRQKMNVNIRKISVKI